MFFSSPIKEAIKFDTKFHSKINYIKERRDFMNITINLSQEELDQLQDFKGELSSLKLGYQISKNVLNDTIKNENGEESNTIKFKSLKEFCMYFSTLQDVYLSSIDRIIEKYDSIIDIITCIDVDMRMKKEEEK